MNIVLNVIGGNMMNKKIKEILDKQLEYYSKVKVLTQKEKDEIEFQIRKKEFLEWSEKALAPFNIKRRRKNEK